MVCTDSSRQQYKLNTKGPQAAPMNIIMGVKCIESQRIWVSRESGLLRYSSEKIMPRVPVAFLIMSVMVFSEMKLMADDDSKIFKFLRTQVRYFI